MKTISGSLQGWATPKQSTMVPATMPVLPRWTRWPTSGASLLARPNFRACGDEVDGHKVVLLKPLTYMNLSGDSIAPMAGFFKIPADHVLVLCDDITQAPGKLRIRPSGSAGGHNGLKSIIARLGGENFPRIRIGIGAKPHPDYDLAAWVLGKFPPEDAKAIADRYPDLEAAAKLIMDGKLSLAQSKYNG